MIRRCLLLLRVSRQLLLPCLLLRLRQQRLLQRQLRMSQFLPFRHLDSFLLLLASILLTQNLRTLFQ
tara:strand:+ start:251 stop:451 length:201 start_codon:yes stop_codon:yes gene_type:complete